MKIVKSSSVTPFGGLNFVIKEAIDLKINKLINSSLSVLANQSKFSWFDIIMSYWSVFFCGGDCAEDLAINLKEGLQNKLYKMPEEAQEKLQETLERIINEGSGGLICIIL